jgi:PAS domain S-box-containing protein
MLFEREVAGDGQGTARALAPQEPTRAQGEEELRASEQQLRMALSAGKFGHWQRNLSGTELEASAQTKAHFGLAPHEPFTYQMFRAAVHPEDRDEIIATIEKATAELGDYECDYRCMWRDGSIHWINSRGRVIPDASGRPAQIIGVTQDITERKLAEAWLAAQKRVLEMLARGAELTDVLSVLIQGIEEQESGISGSILVLSQDRSQFETIVGPSLPEPYTRALAGAPARTPYVGPCAAAVGEGETNICVDIENDTRWSPPWRSLATENGLRSSYSAPIFGSGGRTLGSFGIYWRVPNGAGRVDQDLVRTATHLAGIAIENSQAQRAMRESEEQFRALANSIANLAWMADADGWIFWYNQRWYEYTGSTPEEMQGWGWQRVHDPEMLPQMLERWKHSLASGQPFEMTFPLRGADGRYRSFLTRALPVRGENGKVVRWFGTNTDITAQTEMERALLRANERLRRANFDLEQFAYSAAHDLQEPIRNIAVYGEIINRRYSEALDSSGREFLGFMTSAARRLEQLIRDLLAYTQIARAPEDAEEQADAEDAFGAALLNLAEAIREAGAEITCDKLPVLQIRETELQQLFQNLIANAIKYRRPGEPPRVHVSAKREGSTWRLEVRDNGIGIAPEYSKTVFGLFKRLHTERAYPGTGIGLAICQRIVERHGGRIWVESEPGKGSVFIFTLPATQEQRKHAATS